MYRLVVNKMAFLNSNDIDNAIVLICEKVNSLISKYVPLVTSCRSRYLHTLDNTIN